MHNFTDCDGRKFQYYPRARLVGRMGRLYRIRRFDADRWEKNWDRFRAATAAVSVNFCYIYGVDVQFTNAFPNGRCHLLVSFNRDVCCVLSSDDGHDLYAPYMHPYVDSVNFRWRRIQRWMRRWAALRRQDRALALAMAWHARLGAASALACLDADLVPDLIKRCASSSSRPRPPPGTWRSAARPGRGPAARSPPGGSRWRPRSPPPRASRSA